MDKFCEMCGAQIAEGEAFCGACGAKVEAAAVEAAPAEKKSFDINGIVDKSMAFVGNFIEKAKAKPVLFAIPAGAVVVIIALIVLLASLGGGEEKALKNYIDVMYKGKANKIESLAPQEYWDYYEDEMEGDIDDMKEQFEEYHEYMIEALEEEYGDNVKISYKVTDKEKLSKKKLDKIAEGLKENYDIPKKKVTAAYEIEVELTIKGSDDKDESDAEFCVAKIGGKWYLVSENGDLLVD